MHDLDQTTLELEDEDYAGAPEPGEAESPFDQTREMELASELLEVSSEEELEQFLGNLIQSATRSVRRFAHSKTGRALGGILKGAAKRALPVVGRAVGERFAPGRGGDVGADLAQHLGQLLGLELEGLSQEDREFEAARGFVRFAGAAAQHAASSDPALPPVQAARAATLRAARVYAPGLVPVPDGQWPRAGRWVRHGRTIVVFGR